MCEGELDAVTLGDAEVPPFQQVGAVRLREVGGPDRPVRGGGGGGGRRRDSHALTQQHTEEQPVTRTHKHTVGCFCLVVVSWLNVCSTRI